MTQTQLPTTVLTPHLHLRGAVLFGLSYMAPIVVLGTYGILAGTTNGTVPSAYLLAMVAMLFTAASYGKMCKIYPFAGSAYTYARKAIDSRVGFLVGWAILLDYFFLPMVIWLIGAAYMSAQFPDVPSWVWVVAFIVITTALNVLGIKVAVRVNFLLMAFQLLVIVFFIVLSLRHATGLNALPFYHNGSTFDGISAGAALAAYSFLGFDAVTTLTEETFEPRKTIPRAILLSALIGGVIFVVLAYATQSAHPGSTFRDESSAALEIAGEIGGNVMAAFFLAAMMVAQLASGIATQAGASRLMFAMGRDGVLPKRVFAYLHPKLTTPVFGIVLTGLAGFGALLLDVTTSTSFINFGAFTAFTFVNICVIALWLRRRGSVLTNVVFPAIGAIVDIWLLTHLDGIAVTLGLAWLGLGVCWLAYLTRGFRRPPPEVTFPE